MTNPPTQQHWPGPARESQAERPEPVAVEAAKAGGAGGFVVSLPVIGPALASVCVSCIGIGGAAIVGAVLAWATPAAFALGGAAASVSVWRSLKRTRAACSVAAYRRARRTAFVTLIAVATASFAVSALVIRHFLGGVAEQLGGGGGVLP